MQKTILHVRYACPRAVAEAFIKEVKASGIYEAILKEEGCEGYEYFFPAEGEGFFLAEKWRDEEALHLHSTGKAMAALKALKANYPMETTIEKYKAEEI